MQVKVAVKGCRPPTLLSVGVPETQSVSVQSRLRIGHVQPLHPTPERGRKDAKREQVFPDVAESPDANPGYLLPSAL